MESTRPSLRRTSGISVVLQDLDRQGKRKPPTSHKVSGGRTPRVGPARLERATSCSGGKRSIQLSYGPK